MKPAYIVTYDTGIAVASLWFRFLTTANRSAMNAIKYGCTNVAISKEEGESLRNKHKK